MVGTFVDKADNKFDLGAVCYDISSMSATTPLRIDSALVKEARSMAVLMDRSPTAQVEFWAKLGRVAEAVFAHDRIRLLKETGHLQNLDTLLAKIDTPEGRELAKAVTARQCSLDRLD